MLVNYLKSLQNDSKFDSFYSKVCSDSAILTEEPSLPRVRKIPKRYDTGSTPHQFQNPKEIFRHSYFEALDFTAGEVENRFSQPDLHIIKELEVLLISAGNGKKVDFVPTEILNYLGSDVHHNRLLTQLCMVFDMMKTATPNIKEVTNVRTIADTMNESNIYK